MPIDKVWQQTHEAPRSSWWRSQLAEQHGNDSILKMKWLNGKSKELMIINMQHEFKKYMTRRMVTESRQQPWLSKHY